MWSASLRMVYVAPETASEEEDAVADGEDATKLEGAEETEEWGAPPPVLPAPPAAETAAGCVPPPETPPWGTRAPIKRASTEGAAPTPRLMPRPASFADNACMLGMSGRPGGACPCWEADADSPLGPEDAEADAEAEAGRDGAVILTRSL